MQSKPKSIFVHQYGIVRNIVTILGIISAILFIIYFIFIVGCAFFNYGNTGSGLGWIIMNVFPLCIILFGLSWILIGKGNKKIVLWSIFRTAIYIILISILVPFIVENDLVPYNHHVCWSLDDPCVKPSQDWAIFQYVLLSLLIAGLDPFISIIVTFYKNIKNTLLSQKNGDGKSDKSRKIS